MSSSSTSSLSWSSFYPNFDWSSDSTQKICYKTGELKYYIESKDLQVILQRWDLFWILFCIQLEEGSFVQHGIETLTVNKNSLYLEEAGLIADFLHEQLQRYFQDSLLSIVYVERCQILKKEYALEEIHIMHFFKEIVPVIEKLLNFFSIPYVAKKGNDLVKIYAGKGTPEDQISSLFAASLHVSEKKPL